MSDLVHPADREPTDPVNLDAVGYVVAADGTFGFFCPLDHLHQLAGSRPVDGCGYSTTEWPTAELAAQRGQQHLAEHATGEPMEELWFFRERNNIHVDAAGVATTKDGEG